MSTLLDLLGALLIVVGIGLVSVPAALIVAGVLLLGASYNATSGGKS